MTVNTTAAHGQLVQYTSNSVPARLGKWQGAIDIGHNLACERPKFGHNLARKRQNWAQISKQFTVHRLSENTKTGITCNFFFSKSSRRYVNRAGRKGVQAGCKTVRAGRKTVRAGRKTVRAGRSTFRNMPGWNTAVYYPACDSSLETLIKLTCKYVTFF